MAVTVKLIVLNMIIVGGRVTIIIIVIITVVSVNHVSSWRLVFPFSLYHSSSGIPMKIKIKEDKKRIKINVKIA